MLFKNFARTLRAFCVRRPFSPFMVELSSGTVLRIPHPEALILRGEVAVFTAPDSTQRLFDCTSVCQLYESPEIDLSQNASGSTEELP